MINNAMAEVKRIISIEKYKGKTYCVAFEDDKIYLHSSIISEYHLKEDMTIPEEALDDIIFQNDYRRAKERAFYLFDYRDYSYKELYDKLLKNYSEDVCDAVMEKMCELGLIDDKKYAEKFARQLFEVKKAGKFKAIYEMQQKGLDKEIIDEVLELYEEDTIERLTELVEKKYARYLTDEKGAKKVFNALVRKGYNYSDVREVIKNYLDEVVY